MTRLNVLGGLKLEPSPFTQPKPLVLLSYLSLEGAQQRRHLAELFWTDGQRMKALSMTLTRLRQGVGDAVEIDDKQAKAKLPSDAKELLDLLDKSDWQTASELYKGAFLEGVVLDDWSSELEEWVYTTREYLAERVQYALLNLAEESAKQQSFDKAGELAERAYKLPGLNGSELTHLKRLYPLLCAGRSLLAPEVRKELGEYGLNTPLTTEEARATFKPTTTTNSLPVRGTSFVGRDEELTELAILLSKPNVSLLTVLGPAGVGKTRLALQLAHEEQKLGVFKDGIYFVSLDALSDPSFLAPTLLSQLGLTQQGKTEPLEQLKTFFADKNAFLVLDNFEHLLEGSSLLSQLLGNCPKLQLLVTSRERLNLEEEHSFRLGGLSYPATISDDAKLSEAVQLFRERAQQVQPRFDVEKNLPDVIRICGLVEGLPLGLELAASWVRLMSCQDIASEIERGLGLLVSTSKNVPERHRSLKAAFEGSWKLLSSKEREVLRKLSVFVGGFRREAASDVAGATIPVLASLIDKSLLRVLINGRYDRHPLLYQFTKEKLFEYADEYVRVRDHHARYYLVFAEHADAGLRGKDQVLWFERLNEELDNLRLSLTYFEETDATTALQLATALGSFWNTHGYYGEGSDHLTSLLARTSGDTPIRAAAYTHAANLVWKKGEHFSAETFYRESLKCATALGETSVQAKALTGLGTLALKHRGDVEGARSSFQAALELTEANGDNANGAVALRGLGNLSLDQGNYQRARTYYEAAQKLEHELGNPHNRAQTHINLATVLVYLGELGRAHALNQEALELFRKVGDKHGTAIALLNIGFDYEGSDRSKGNVYYQESLQLFRDLGDKRMVSHLLNNLGGNFQRLGELDKAKEHLTESLTIQQQVGDVSLIAHALYNLGQVQCDEGDLVKARQTYQECTELCRKNDDNWTLMRVLEVSAKLRLLEQDYECAKAELEEAHVLSQNAGDKKTLLKILETQARLTEAVSVAPKVAVH